MSIASSGISIRSGSKSSVPAEDSIGFVIVKLAVLDSYPSPPILNLILRTEREHETKKTGKLRICQETIKTVLG